MRSENAKANDLFLLMLNLSQISLRDRIIDVFLEATSEIWPNVTPSFSLSFSESENNSIEITTAGSHFGFISIENFTELKSENQDLLHNACGMLAVILKKNEQEELIADEKLHLEKLVEERTQHLNKEIQDRKQAEEALRRNEMLLHNVLNLSPAYICAKNLEGRFLLANQKLADFYGRTVEELTRHTPLRGL